MTYTSLFAGSFDPITDGHLDIIYQAARYSDETIVAVLNNDQKAGRYLFNLDTRLEMTRRAVQEMGLNDKITVVATEPQTVLADLYLKYNCSILFRGIRNEADKAYEEQQMAAHKLILPTLQVGYLYPKEKVQHISSTLVKTFAHHHVDVSPYVPAFIKQELEEKVAGQYKIAVTGEMATGKSWVTDKLVEYLNLTGHSAKSIKLDNLIREIYDDQTPGSAKLREDLVSLTQLKEVLNPGGQTVNRKVLAEFLFHPSTGAHRRDQIEQCTLPLLKMKYREALHNFRGIVVFEWAQLAEMGMGQWTNYNCIVVNSPDRTKFIQNRGLSEKDVTERAKTQWSAEEKLQSLQDAAEHGKMTGRFQRIYSNKMGPEGETNLQRLGDQVVKHFLG
jgi:pantetheine-phosphate adenylyltransferase